MDTRSGYPEEMVAESEELDVYHCTGCFFSYRSYSGICHTEKVRTGISDPVPYFSESGKPFVMGQSVQDRLAHLGR